MEILITYFLCAFINYILMNNRLMLVNKKTGKTKNSQRIIKTIQLLYSVIWIIGLPIMIYNKYKVEKGKDK